jgi:hypothetical protein
LLFPLCVGPSACCCAELLSAAGALPQVNGYFDFAGFGVGRAVPFFDEVLSVDELAAVLAFRVWVHTFASFGAFCSTLVASVSATARFGPTSECRKLALAFTS